MERESFAKPDAAATSETAEASIAKPKAMIIISIKPNMNNVS